MNEFEHYKPAGGWPTTTHIFKVEYLGFLQTVKRYFLSRELAEQWAQQVGVDKRCTIEQVSA